MILTPVRTQERVQWLSRVTSARVPQVSWDLIVKVKVANVALQFKNNFTSSIAFFVLDGFMCSNSSP